MLGESQRNTSDLLEKAIPELARRGMPIVVLIDEVDSLATDNAATPTRGAPGRIVYKLGQPVPFSQNYQSES